MSNIKNFISTKNFGTFEELKEFFVRNDIDVKEDGNEYMLCFKDTSDLNEKWVRECNGTIFEKNTNKLLHYFFEKTYDGLSGIPGNERLLKEENINNDLFPVAFLGENIRISIYLEGSLIKVYPVVADEGDHSQVVADEGDHSQVVADEGGHPQVVADEGRISWKVATSRAINAATNFWNSDKSFKEMFAEGVSNTFELELSDYLSKLDPNYCYSFLLQHPDNNKILPVTEPVVHFINKVHLETLEETTLDLEYFSVVGKGGEPVTCIKDLERSKISDNYLIYVLDTEGKIKSRIKYLNDKFTSKRELYGNYPNLGLRYLEMYNNDGDFRNNLINNFPEQEELLDEIDRKFLQTSNEIFALYRRIYMQKNKIQIIKKYKRPIYVLHGIYLETKKNITLQDVLNYMYNLDPWVLANLIEFNW